MTRGRLVLTLFAVATAVLAGCGDDGGGAPRPSGTMILATTTSTKDTGLLDELVPAFERTSDCTVKTVAVGSGQALKLGARGDADVLLVHSPADELAYMRAGDGASRRPVMFNDFILVGPGGDPAGVQGLPAARAFDRIAAEKAPFASRGDDSGTNAKELAIWKAADIDPKGPWYFETGQGMGQTLQVASQKRAYTLTDRGTFLATKNLDLGPLVEGGSVMRNPYHVIVVRHDGTNRACAAQFSSWIVSPPAQRMIGAFGVDRYGQRLFTPDAR